MRLILNRSRARVLVLLLVVAAAPLAPARQQPDPNFSATVASPAYPNKHPKVLFDEAHSNSHTAGHTYKAFVSLITSDGYRVTPGRERFSKESLKGYDVLVIIDATGPQSQTESSAFTEQECDTVRDWVMAGGALLLAAGHRPHGGAAAALAKRFGVEVTAGHSVDKVNHNPDGGEETEIVFSRENKMLAAHAITEGRGAAERINRVMTFSGTSVKGPEKSVAFLRLGDTSFDVLPPDPEPMPDPLKPPDHKVIPAAGRAQGVALEFGKGRVVVFAEPNALTAQVTKGGLRYGMNMAGLDNQQLALNIMRWLSGLLK